MLKVPEPRFGRAPDASLTMTQNARQLLAPLGDCLARREGNSEPSFDRFLRGEKRPVRERAGVFRRETASASTNGRHWISPSTAQNDTDFCLLRRHAPRHDPAAYARKIEPF